MDFPPRPTTDYSAIDSELDRHEADAYVHVGDCFDEMLYYLTRFRGPDREYAFVYVDGSAVLCAPDRFGDQANREFPGDVVDTRDASKRPPATERAETVLENHGPIDHLLLPANVKHRTVTAFEDAGYEVVLTDTLIEGRTVKTAEERAHLKVIETVAQRAMARAETVLAEATISDGRVTWKDERLTTERLRREINAVIAAEGATDAGNVVVGAGRSCADLHFVGDDEVAAGETVLIDLGPRGPSGYYGDLTRTFVPGNPGEWEREAYAAVSDAFTGAMGVLEDGAGIRAARVQERISEELGAYGWETGDVEAGMYHGPGHGIGVSIHEPPFLSTDARLAAGNVVTIEPGVYDPEHGGVRLEDMVVITEDGYENLVSYPKEIAPTSQSL